MVSIVDAKYNPQNEMFRRFRTKCSIFQNETYLRESFFLPINQIKKHRKNLLLRCFFIACLNEGGVSRHNVIAKLL